MTMTSGQRGFTLVEMLVALGVAALLVSLVYGAVRIGQRSATAMDQHVAQTETMRIGWQFLHDALTRALPVPDPEDAEEPSSFAGASNVLAFIADMPAYVGLGGLMRITLQIDDTAAERQLVLTRQRFDASGEAPPEEGVARAVLVEDLEDLEITYFGRIEPDEPADWHEEWRGIQTLPNLVRVAIKPSGATAWPDLIASPFTGSEPLDEDDSLEDAETPETEEEPREDGVLPGEDEAQAEQ